MLLGVVSRQMFLSWVSKVLLRLLLTLLCAITSKSDSWQRDCWISFQVKLLKPNMFMSILSSLDPSPCPGLNLLGSSWYLVPFVLIVRESQFGFGPRWILRRWQGHVLATPFKNINSNCFRKWLQLWKTVWWLRYRIWVMYSSSCAHRFEHVVLFGQEGIWKGIACKNYPQMFEIGWTRRSWANHVLYTIPC